MNTSAFPRAADGFAARERLFERIGSVGGATAPTLFGVVSLLVAIVLPYRAVAANFKQALVERASSAGYAVVLRGFSGEANAQDFAKEATGAGFPVKLETLP